MNLREIQKKRILDSYIQKSFDSKQEVKKEDNIEKSIKDSSVESLTGLLNSQKIQNNESPKYLCLDNFKSSSIFSHYTSPMPEVEKINLPAEKVEKSSKDEMEKEDDKKEEEKDEEKEIVKGFIDWKDSNNYNEKTEDLVEMYSIEKSLTDEQKGFITKALN